MLSKESALTWYQRIAENEKSGNYEQKVLGLRRIFNSVLLEMFPNISEQAFYCTCIDLIFKVKKNSGEYHYSFGKRQREYHQLRLYFNNLMHSKIEADEKGYLTAVSRLSSLINFCSQIEIPTDVSIIYANAKVTESEFHERNRNCTVNETTTKIESTTIVSSYPTLCLIVDRRNDLSNTELQEIENGIKNVTKNAIKGNVNFVVFTIKTNSSILAFPISEKKTRFSFNGISEEEQINPLRDYLVNLNPAVQYHFFLTKASAENRFRIPISLNELSFIMSIGIIENGNNHYLSDSRCSSRFDKLVLDSNLPSFFDWVGKIITNK
ncbi:MAG: hypothetical protein K2H01_03355 [Ruminococcus sp.]|nr:hypothetical protein [Ruminococcus sp.]